MNKLWVKTFNHFICAKEAFDDWDQVKNFIEKMYHLSLSEIEKQNKRHENSTFKKWFSEDEIYTSVVIVKFDDSSWEGKDILCLNEAIKCEI